MARQTRLKLQEIRGKENRELKFEGGTLVWNYEADRLQILFDNIPDDRKRKELKSNGFSGLPNIRHGNASLHRMPYMQSKEY
nr:hypothetical protein [Phocaeicola plebeius]